METRILKVPQQNQIKQTNTENISVADGLLIVHQEYWMRQMCSDWVTGGVTPNGDNESTESSTKF